MPWFYAGPEAKPVGPVSVEELHACRLRGAISPETYVIEQTSPPGAAMVWRRYREVFPGSPALPPLPPVPLPVPVSPAAAAPHPIFPSAAANPPGHPAPVSALHPAPIKRPTNAWCAWGFWLGLLSFVLSLACGMGAILAPLALILCVIGLTHVVAHREQGGQYQAVGGIVLCVIALLIGIMMIYWVDLPFFKAHGLTVTEQTSSDSD